MQRARTMVVAVVFVGLALSVGSGVAAGAPTTDGSTDAAAADDEANLTVFVAPGSDLATMRGADTEADYGNVTLTSRSHVTLADTLVVQVSAPGLENAVRSQPGNGTTTQFLSLLDSDKASMTAAEAFTASDTTPKAFSLNDPETTSVTHVDDRTYQLVVDMSAVEPTLDANGNGLPDDEGSAPVESGDVYQLRFSFDDYAKNGSILVFPVTVEFDAGENGNSPVLYPMPDQQVRAKTTLAPGTELRIELTGTGAEPFQRTKTVRVTGRNQPGFTASFDLVDVAAGQPLLVVAKNGDQNIGKAEGTIPKLTASLSVPDRVDTQDRIQVSRVNFSQNGFLVVRSGGPDGPIVGNRYLQPGTYNDLSVRFSNPVQADTLHVSAYVDIDADRIFDRDGIDRPFRREGSAVSAVVDVTGTTGTPAVTTRPPQRSTTQPPDVPSTSAGTTPIVTPSGSGTSARTVGPSTTTGKNTTGFTPYTISADGPGFSLSVAVAAVLFLSGLLAWRR